MSNSPQTTSHHPHKLGEHRIYTDFANVFLLLENTTVKNSRWFSYLRFSMWRLWIVIKHPPHANIRQTSPPRNTQKKNTPQHTTKVIHNGKKTIRRVKMRGNDAHLFTFKHGLVYAIQHKRSGAQQSGAHQKSVPYMIRRCTSVTLRAI